MGLFSKQVAGADVSFSGITEFANSGDDEFTISATATVEQGRQLGGKEPLPMLGSLGAVTLLSMLRREAHYVIPFMSLIESVSEGLLDEDVATEDFAIRDCVVTDPEMLNIMVGASEGLGGDSMHTAAVNGSLPVLTDVLPGEVERTTQVLLKEGRNGLGYVRFKFGMGSANALTTIGAWTATVDRLATSAPREEVAVPIANGLKVLRILWESMGYPNGFSVQESAEVGAAVTDTTARYTPD
jgi:hypothetical protein